MDTNINKKHKSSVFSILFGTPEVLKELYSAIEGIDIPKNAVININTLSDVLYMRQINDVSFTIDDRIVVLIEHQSTINNNVPVRLLMYIARVYEKILDRETLYQRKTVKIPAPEFYILYNGIEPFEDRKELRLSSAFKSSEGIKQSKNEGCPLELTVQVLNINQGRNPEILTNCNTLNGYSIFISKIREYSASLPLDESIKAAIKYCIGNNILAHFLKEHGSEVVNMLTDDFTVEEIAAIRSKEAWEEGWEKGYNESREYFIELLSQGFSVEELRKRVNDWQGGAVNNA